VLAPHGSPVWFRDLQILSIRYVLLLFVANATFE
jgi:hypothetical protein